MSEQHSGTRTLENHDRLNGWKEISVYLGRGVRTAQRWERELGLPIHRVRIETGEVVYALRTELDQWQASQEVVQESKDVWNGRQEDQEIEETTGVGEKSDLRKRIERLIGAALAMALLAVAAWGAWMNGLFQKMDRQPSSFEVKGDTLKVFNERGEKLWEHRFHFQLSDNNYRRSGTLYQLLSLALEDLDNDGEKELLIVTFGDLRYAGRLLCFNRDGSVRFDVQPNRSLRYGGKEYAPPFFVHGFVLTPEPNGTKSVWAVAVHNYEFPSVLLKLTAQGKVAGEYWSNGHIDVMHEGQYVGRRVIVVGAKDNERVAASLAVLDYENPNGFAPSENPKYLCENCPGGEPLVFDLFPRTEMSREFDTRPNVNQIRVLPDGRVTVTVMQMFYRVQGEPGDFGADIWYTFDQRLQLVEAESGDTYRRLHSHPELIGRLKHKFGPKCEEEILPVLAWNGKGFVKMNYPMTTQNPSRKTLAQTRTPQS